MIIYRKGREVARSDGDSSRAFANEMAALGLGVPGA